MRQAEHQHQLSLLQTTLLRYIQICRNSKVNVFGYDYSGYGASTGRPLVSNTYADIIAAYDYLVEQAGVPRKSIILYGQSVGSGPSCKLAASRKRPVRALILHSPILSGLRVLVENRGPLCCFDIYPNNRRIAKVRCPVMVIHGDHDDQVGFAHGVRLHNSVPEKHKYEPYWVHGGGHNNIVDLYPVEFYNRLNQFLEALRREDLGPKPIEVI